VCFALVDVASLRQGQLHKKTDAEEIQNYAVTNTNPSNNDVLQYSTTTSKYELVQPSALGVVVDKIAEGNSSVEVVDAGTGYVSISVDGNEQGRWTAATGLVVVDHGTAATDQVVNVCYGTGDPPTASTTTEGALYIKYTA
jgi:hypothetical protein